MRVLLVSHLYPPAHTAGTEVYAAELARRLSARGHEVAVFTTDKDVGRPDFSTRDRVHDGIPVRELVNNLFHEDFRQTWEHPRAERAFAAFLDEFAPDVVHVHHLMYLSVGCLELAASRAALVYTLHDFWLGCARMGQLLHADGTLCPTLDFARCGTCLPDFKWRQTDVERRTGRWIARVHAATGVDLGPLARRARRGLLERRAPTESPPRDAAVVEGYERAARERWHALLGRALATVDRFVSPSAFLRERFVEWGVPPERIEHLPTGLDPARFRAASRDAPAGGGTGPLRVLFLGTLVPVKGAHVLLDAWGRLDERQRARAQLVLHGPRGHAPEYAARLDARAREVGARLAPPLERGEVGPALARADLLVVPSLWYENRPLVVLEAQGLRTPVLASDLGGLVELVGQESGWRFPVGDAGALADRLRALLADPSQLARCYAREVVVPTWDELAERMEALYREVRRARR